MTRAFDDDDVTHVEGDVNPVRDIEIINEELRLKDVEAANIAFEKIAKLVERGDKKNKIEYETLVKVKRVLEVEKRHLRFGDWTGTDILEVEKRHLRFGDWTG